MVHKLIFNEQATQEQIDFDFGLRGYKLVPNQSESMCFRKYLSPGKEPLQKEIFLHYNRDKHYFWCWIPETQIECFINSTNVDVELSTNRVASISTQTD